MRQAIAQASREEALRQLAGIEAESARRDLKVFVRKVWHLVEPDKELLWNWHLDIVASALCDVTAGRCKRLVINIPPGCMKSLLVSVIWPAWEWASMPGLRYLTASYGSQLSIRDNLRLRDIVTSPWFRDSYGVRMAGDQNAKERFENVDGGWRIATSVGGVGTGEHPDRIIIDDPHTAQQARSAVERQTAIDWFKRTVSSRGIARERAIVVIMQRLHQEDLAGHLLKMPGWQHVCLPMRFEPGPNVHPRDPRRTAGELLWPKLFPEPAVKQLELDLDPYGAASQLQQRPSPEGGGLFKRAWFKIVDELPKVAAPMCRGWDTAGTAGGGDWTVGVKIMGPVNGIWYVCDVARGQWSPAEVDRIMLQTAQVDGIHVRQREEKEPGSSGKAVIDARSRSLARFDYAGVQISGDKVTRARPFRAQCEAGNVCLLRGAWNEAYLRELEHFPVGENDDQADGSSCAYNELAAGPPAVRQVGVSWG